LSPIDEPVVDANATAAPSVPDALEAIPDVEAKWPYAVTPVADVPVECETAAALESGASIPPGRAVFAECPKPRRPGFGPLFQVWHEWSTSR
jgi:hypothetical protein